MKRRLPRSGEIVRTIRHHAVDISAGTIAGGGIVSAPFLKGRLDETIAFVGAPPFSYLVIRVYRSINNRIRQNADREENDVKN